MVKELSSKVKRTQNAQNLRKNTLPLLLNRKKNQNIEEIKLLYMRYRIMQMHNYKKRIKKLNKNTQENFIILRIEIMRQKV